MQAPYKRNATHWKAPDREWLFYEHMELGKPLIQIAEEIRVDPDTVQRWVAKLKVHEDLDRPYIVGTGCGMRVYGITRKWLYSEYVEKDQSAKQIGDSLGVSHASVVRWVRKHGILVRARKATNERHSHRMSGNGNPAWSGGTARTYQARILTDSDRLKQCVWCGTTEKLQIHHLDHDRDNGDLSNLVWLCVPCNRLESHAWALQKLGRATFHYEDKQLIVRFQ